MSCFCTFHTGICAAGLEKALEHLDVKHRFTSRVEGVKEIQEADKEELLFLQLMITLAFCTFLYCCMVYNFSVW